MWSSIHLFQIIVRSNFKPDEHISMTWHHRIGNMGVAKELNGSHMTPRGVASYLHAAPETYEKDEYEFEVDI
jgi:hypothetical protein